MATPAELELQLRKFHIVPDDAPYASLNVKEAFDQLSHNEKVYAAYLSQASWEGSKLCFFQVSYEAPIIFLLLQKIFKQNMDELKAAAMKSASAVSEEHFKSFLTYAAAFYTNMGNFQSFGDSRIIPGLPKASFRGIMEAGSSYKEESELMRYLYQEAEPYIYSLESSVRQIGFRPEAYNSYYSDNMTKDEIDLIQRYLEKKNIAAANTRVMKTLKGDGVKYFDIRLASATVDMTSIYSDFEGSKVRIVQGDYHSFMKRVNANLEKAKEHGCNETQIAMHAKYIESFQSGSIDAHKEASKHWVTDISPSVESYIGFIETYRDPLGVRADWEGFVAVVNRKVSEKFTLLVNSAEGLLDKLPWSKEFEKDTFLKPDFTSLDILAFAGTGVPAGINIPNYDDIRQDIGFKNVSLGNVLASSLKYTQPTFLSTEDADIFRRLSVDAFEVQVGLHELLGHGSGKLFIQDENGHFNFDFDNIEMPDLGNGEKAKLGWYTAGETWDSKFPVISSSYEECRAECVGIYLCTEMEAMQVFGHHDEATADDIMYANWLLMARSGLVALEVYRPEAASWGQAHMQARFAILSVMLEAGQGLIDISEHPELGILLTLDRKKILSVGKPAIGRFLNRLQIYKSTANYEAAKEMYDQYTIVKDKFLVFRDIVLRHKAPRRILVQPHLSVSFDGKEEVVNLQEFPASAEGVIASFQARFSSQDEELLNLWKSDKAFMKYDVRQL